MSACSICAHPDREAIEAALAAGQSYRSTARQHQVSKSALVRHRQHDAKQRVSTDGEALRRQIEALRRQIEALQERAQVAVAGNIVYIGPMVQEMARLMMEMYEHDGQRSSDLHALQRKLGEIEARLAALEERVVDECRILRSGEDGK